ncbi:MAG: hypothetical protein ABII13_00965 [Patescibacteria group bacterium]
MEKSDIAQGIIGHTTILHLLDKWLEKPANGYIFHGPAHLGKRTIAERFIRHLLTPDAGRRTPDDLMIHPDFFLLQPEEGKRVISVDQVRKARVRLSERPMVALRQIMFVPQAECFNEEGMNALLKVLEEPTVGTVFVFVTENVERLPATVKSRMVKVPFNPVSCEDIVKALCDRKISNTQAEERAKASRGRPGLAIEPITAIHDLPVRFLDASCLGERLEIIDKLNKACESEEDVNQAWSEALNEWAEIARQYIPTKPEYALVAGQGIITAQHFVGGPLSPRLPLEAAAVKMGKERALANLFPSHMPSSLPRIFI